MSVCSCMHLCVCVRARVCMYACVRLYVMWCSLLCSSVCIQTRISSISRHSFPLCSSTCHLMLPSPGTFISTPIKWRHCLVDIYIIIFNMFYGTCAIHVHVQLYGITFTENNTFLL